MKSNYFCGLIAMMLCLLTFNALVSAAHLDRFYITDFGAKSDGKTINTKMIQKAIDQASLVGGTVVVPKGIFLTGTLFVKSNVTFEVTAMATIKGSPNIKDYTEMVWGHNRDRQPYHLIMIQNAENVTIQGSGTIDGDWTSFVKDFDPNNFPQWVLAKDLKVSPMFEVWKSKNVRIKDVTLKTGGGWTCHLYDSDLIQVQGAKILNNLYAPNGDGIDISGCEDVTISDCIIKTCDDAICLKTMGDTRACRRVVVTNCIIECSCAALKIGNESFYDITQVTFSNCIVFNSSRAIGIYAESAGKIEDIIISNIVCDTKAPLLYNRPIHITLMNGNSGGMTGETHVDSKVYDRKGRTPSLKNVIISNFICKTEGRILITAQEGMMIENLVLRDVILDYPMLEDPVPLVDRIKSSQFSPRNPEAKKAKAALVVENVKNLVVEGLLVHWPKSTDAIPQDWQHPRRIANGTLDFFTPDYSKTKPVEFSVVWGRNLEGGYIRAPLTQPSDPSIKTFDLEKSTIKVF